MIGKVHGFWSGYEAAEFPNLQRTQMNMQDLLFVWFVKQPK